MDIYPKGLSQSLDFEIVKKHVAAFCQTAGGKERVETLSPWHNSRLLSVELSKVNELLGLFQSSESFPSTSFDPVGKFLHRLAIDGTFLEAEQFAEIRSAFLIYENLYRSIISRREKLPNLYQMVFAKEPVGEIKKEIDKRIDERGQVRSNASPQLSRIRSELTKKRASADRIFARAVKKYRDKGLLADFDETVSDNRRVLAIQSSYKGQVQGIFHGSSSKQAVVYIEPGETVEINNDIAFLQDEGRQEIRRILRELSTVLRPFTPWLITMEEMLYELDFIKAKASYAHREEACLPQISDTQRIFLKEAYNPVLRFYHQQRKREAIPLDLELTIEERILVISGPNAGGKSIALKTLGLLQLMLQCGLLVPVHPDSHFCLFEKLYGDIGDSQSIENELSTYSSKLQKMKHFLDFADERTLLLIDEFGSGSDPELGSSLAQVFLQKLNSFGCFGIFTTHYNAIKAIAANTAGIVNGAMLFNTRNFVPEYRLEMGNPGSSFTFEVAQKSGISPHIIKEAREKTAQNILDVDHLLVQLQDDKQKIEVAQRKMTRELKKLNELKRTQQQTIDKLEDKLQKQSRMNEEYDRATYWGQRFQKLVESWMGQNNQKDKKAVVSRFIAMLNQRSGEIERQENKDFKKATKNRQQKIENLINEEVKIGDKIKILSNGVEGTILEKKGNKYQIALGGNITALLDRDKFVKASAQLEARPKKKKRKKSFNKTQKQKSKEDD